MAMKKWDWVDVASFVLVVSAGVGLIFTGKNSVMQAGLFIALAVILSADRMTRAIKEKK